MIIIGADHGGFELKEKLKFYLAKKNVDIVDVGAFKLDSADNFSDFVKLMISVFDKNKNAKIIAVCSSGVGMSIGLNKHRGIFCANGHNVQEIKKAREHNNINALALSGSQISTKKAKDIIDIFLTTEFLGGKYRVRMLDVDNE